MSDREVDELRRRVEALESLVAELMLNGPPAVATAPAGAPVAPPVAPPVAMGGRYLVLRVAARLFGVPLAAVVEVVRNAALEPVPGAPRALAGLLDLRGRPVDVIDLRVAFGEAPLDLDLDSRIVVVGRDGRAHGLLVDEAVELALVEGRSVEPPPPTAGRAVLSGLARLRDRLVLLLDVAAVAAGVERDEVLEAPAEGDAGAVPAAG